MTDEKPLGDCTQAEIDAWIETIDSKNSRLLLMWRDRALKAEAALAVTPALAERLKQRATDFRKNASGADNQDQHVNEMVAAILDNYAKDIAATPEIGGQITDALLFACDEAACDEDPMFYEIFKMDDRWDIIRTILKAARQ